MKRTFYLLGWVVAALVACFTVPDTMVGCLVVLPVLLLLLALSGSSLMDD
jgi:hypothetical protein